MEAEGTSLDDLLNGEPTEAPAEVAEPIIEAQEPETIGQPRGPDGKFLPKQETGVEEPQQAPEPSAEPVPPTADRLPQAEYAALRDERRKRQEAEARIAALEQQFQAAQVRQPEPEIDFWDNPQGVIATQVQRAVLEALQAEKQQQQMARINEAEERAKAAHADYDDAFRAFQQAAMANPTLIQQMTLASDPAEFAYSKGKTALELERVGSIDELLRTKRAEWEAEARAAMPAPPTLPQTTATDGSVGGRTGPAWAGPAPLGDLLR